jgi:hypothetical protein
VVGVYPACWGGLGMINHISLRFMVILKCAYGRPER